MMGGFVELQASKDFWTGSPPQGRKALGEEGASGRAENSSGCG